MATSSIPELFKISDDILINHFARDYEKAVELARDDTCNTTLETFKQIAGLMRPEYVRGAVNKDNDRFGKYGCIDHCLIQCALVYRGMKPLTIDRQYKGYQLIPDWFGELGLTYTKIPSIHNSHIIENEYVIYRENLDPNSFERVSIFIEYYSNTQSSSDASHHSIMGFCLGYPPEDIEHFIEVAKQRQNENKI